MNAKKLVSLVLALVMMLALSTSAMAETYSITIKNENTNSTINGKKYVAYKVFDLSLADTDDNTENGYEAYSYSIDNDGDGEWAWITLIDGATTDATTGVINTKYGLKLTPSASDATVYTVEKGTMTDDLARTLADDLAKAGLPTTGGVESAAAVNETAAISMTEPGYYAVYGVVVPKDPSEDPVEEVVAALALTSTDPTVEINPKAEVPTLDKKITGEFVLDNAGKAASAQVGATVNFEIDSVVPDLTGYSDYTFKITDTMSTGLTFTDPDGDATNDVVVKINNDDKTSNATIAVNSQTLTVTIPYTTLSAATKGQSIVVTYSAVINENALTTDYENNTAKLTYSSNPSSTTDTNDTPDKTVYVIEANINVDKVAGSANGAKLAGAKFKVFKGATQPADDAQAWYKWDATSKVVTWVAKADAEEFTTGDTGVFTPAVQGLEASKDGTSYGLLETVAPTGYNLLDAPVIVTLTGAYSDTDKKATVTASNNATVTNGAVDLTAAQNTNQPLATAQVVNKSGAALPETGGMGTTVLYIAGGLLVAAAVILMITKRRANAAE